MTRRASSFLLILSLVGVAAFLWWLYRTTGSLETSVAPEFGDGETPELVEFSASAIAGNPAGSVGATGVLRSVSVAQRLGRGAFAVRLDTATTFSVLMSADLIQRGTEVYAQDTVTVYGHIFTFNDSIRAAWVREQAVDGQNAGAVPAMPSFLMADSVSFN